MNKAEQAKRYLELAAFCAEQAKIHAANQWFYAADAQREIATAPRRLAEIDSGLVVYAKLFQSDEYFQIGEFPHRFPANSRIEVALYRLPEYKEPQG